MNLAGKERSRQLVTVGIGTVLTLVMGAVLIAGFRLATQMRANITALQSASMLQTYPAAMTQQFNALRDRLESRAYAGQALADLKTTVARFDSELDKLSTGGSIQSPELDQALLLWHQYGPVVNPVVQFNGQPYVDSDDAGSSFSKEGRTYYADVKRAQLFANDNQKGLQAQLASVATELQRASSDAAARLRALLSAGVLAALVLAAAAAYFQITRSRHERAAQEAQEQTRDILKTVREGFFLLDADYKIGSVWSEALTRMFSRNDFAGLGFEDLLKNLVPADHARHRDEVHQAAVGRPRARKPDEEHQSPGTARNHDGQRTRRQGNALPAVRLPPRYGSQGHQARAVRRR